MKAIQTKYLGPTTHKGSRVKAYDLDGNSFTIPWDYGKKDSDIHLGAVMGFCEKYDWPPYQWHFGSTKDGYTWIACQGSSLHS